MFCGMGRSTPSSSQSVLGPVEGTAPAKKDVHIFTPKLRMCPWGPGRPSHDGGAAARSTRGRQKRQRPQRRRGMGPTGATQPPLKAEEAASPPRLAGSFQKLEKARNGFSGRTGSCAHSLSLGW